MFLKLRPVVVAEAAAKPQPPAAAAAKKQALATPSLAPLGAAPTVIRDFFGRPVERKPPPEGVGETVAAPPAPAPAAPAMRYKFNAGFTNAVRRPVYMREFLGTVQLN